MPQTGLSVRRWQVLVDSPDWERPARVAAFATFAEADAKARRLNAPALPGRPLYFVELWETSNVLDTDHS